MKFVGLLSVAVMAGLAVPASAATPSPNVPSLAPVTALTPGQEQAYAAELSNCFALKSTGGDRLDIARWFVAALASAPQIVGVATVDKARKDALDKQMAGLFTRLMTQDCAEQVRPLFKARSAAGIRAAGETMGRLAMQELLSDPAAASATLGGYTAYLREDDFAALTK